MHTPCRLIVRQTRDVFVVDLQISCSQRTENRDDAVADMNAAVPARGHARHKARNYYIRAIVNPAAEAKAYRLACPLVDAHHAPRLWRDKRRCRAGGRLANLPGVKTSTNYRTQKSRFRNMATP